MSQLWNKYVPVINVYPVCSLHKETIYHALVTCPFATQCWQTGLPNIILNAASDFSDWLLQNFQNRTKDECAVIATFCWTIWKARNDLVWNQKHAQVYVIVASANQHLMQWNDAQLWSSKSLFQPQIK